MSNAEGGGAQFFRHPLEDFRHSLKITLPPPGRNPENAPVLDGHIRARESTFLSGPHCSTLVSCSIIYFFYLCGDWPRSIKTNCRSIIWFLLEKGTIEIGEVLVGLGQLHWNLEPTPLEPGSNYTGTGNQLYWNLDPTTHGTGNQLYWNLDRTTLEPETSCTGT